MTRNQHQPTSDRQEKFLCAKAAAPDRLGPLLELYRRYLFLLADLRLDAKLRARISPSDIVQETMLEAHRDFHQFRGQTESEFICWLKRILTNNLARTIEMHVTAAKRDIRREVSLDQHNKSVDPASIQRCTAITCSEEIPSVQAERRENAQFLNDAINELPIQYRKVLQLRSLQGCSFNEVAEQMSRSVPAAKMLWARAFKQLQQRFER
ncbi:MAG: sigma-70 family RNA polymerase sigma factor [Pirellulaceae bacterium]|nr:sigma-70 family RNA polymerase sigma factor [Pirellulaceae bacterium]